MADVIVIGGGPAGYSAALFTAKYGLETVVYDPDETKMHSAYLYNYLGFEEIHGSDLIEAGRRQVKGFGADVRDEKISTIERQKDGFRVVAESGGAETASYVIICTGLDTSLLKALGVEMAGKEAKVDEHGRTSADRVYAAGWVTRNQSQAIISAGDGAAAAIHLIAQVKGEPYHDFDVPEGD